MKKLPKIKLIIENEPSVERLKDLAECLTKIALERPHSSWMIENILN
ncbi:hypothetical protein ACQKD9_11945 [Bacillus paramycoides]